MDEKLLKKLKKLLKKAGIEDEKVEKVVTELESEDDPGDPEPDAPASEEPKEPTESDVPNPDEETPVPEEEAELPPEEPVEELPPEEEPPVPPVEELPPAEEMPPVEPPVASGVGLEVFQSAMEEKDKTINALAARIDSLEEALKAAGVIKGEEIANVGGNPASAPANPVEESGGLDDFLKQVNNGGVSY